MEKSLEFLNLATINNLLATFPDTDIEFKEEVIKTIENLLDNIKTQPMIDEALYDISNIYQDIIKKLTLIKEEEEYLFFNFKRVVNLQGKVFSKIVENRDYTEILGILKRVNNILEKDRRVLLTYLLEEPKRMKDILKMMDINKMLGEINNILENMVKNKKEVS